MLQITPEGRKLIWAALGGAFRDPWRQRGKITLAGPQPAKAKPRKLNRDRQARFVDNCVTIMGDGTPSHFEFEGACRSGIRSGLCEEGWSWREADRAAAIVVETALNRIGAIRPTWAEAQADFAIDPMIERVFCAHCGMRIPPDRVSSNGTPVKWCSDECGHVARTILKNKSGERVSRAEHLARCSVATQRTLEERATDCAHCGKRFLTRRTDIKYCSQACYHAGQVYLHPRQCEMCGTEFKPANGGEKLGRYCSNECSGLARRRTDLERSCPVCFTGFRLRSVSDRRKFCSLPCSITARRLGAAGIICEAVT
ncbi:hypothetical protein ACFPOB_15900 [Bosea eneae]|uniref:Uncharacterized protein n=1 Tax=Bosea eneae TaxID=151454 RepID=A0ABW0IVD1_9HYPH